MATSRPDQCSHPCPLLIPAQQQRDPVRGEDRPWPCLQKTLQGLFSPHELKSAAVQSLPALPSLTLFPPHQPPEAPPTHQPSLPSGARAWLVPLPGTPSSSSSLVSKRQLIDLAVAHSDPAQPLSPAWISLPLITFFSAQPFMVCDVCSIPNRRSFSCAPARLSAARGQDLCCILSTWHVRRAQYL